MKDIDEDRALDQLIERLSLRFPEVPCEVIEEVVGSAHRRFDDAHIRVFIPVLVEHEAVDKLWTHRGPRAANPANGTATGHVADPR